MFDWLFFLIAVAAGGGAEEEAAAPPAATAPEAAETAAATAPEAAAATAAEVPTGKFTTAQEVRPILTATKGNWVAIREYDGQDLLYVTHLMSWRCGLAAISFSVNGGPMQDWPLPPCHLNTATPNAITAEDGLPFLPFPIGSLQAVDVVITYDDQTRDSASFLRNAVLMP